MYKGETGEPNLSKNGYNLIFLQLASDMRFLASIDESNFIFKFVKNLDDFSVIKIRPIITVALGDRLISKRSLLSTINECFVPGPKKLTVEVNDTNKHYSTYRANFSKF